ncbi:hypothetical protein GDO81_021340 [Engystomops pustulosus]|uniref:Maturase K n=1 Tax=Engystomops pustulosus TaxID=76066 RepID=A0AAV6YYN7_ENGPU|nr:hypothetical protein GDO81_021340 [Engystomops pustulosus]
MWDSPYNDVMSLEAFDRFIGNIWINYRHTCWMYLKAHLKHIAFLCNIMGKSEEISRDIKKRIVHKLGLSLGAIFRNLMVPRLSVQTRCPAIRKHRKETSYVSQR